VHASSLGIPRRGKTAAMMKNRSKDFLVHRSIGCERKIDIRLNLVLSNKSASPKIKNGLPFTGGSFGLASACR
jgi:hypothetical protein